MASSIGYITEIVNRILETVYDHDSDNHDGDGITHTEIMYAVYLSGGSLREFLIALTIHGLLIYDPTLRTYHITESGIRFLELYSNLGDMMT
jgi:predicted transcriptional regulator